MASQRSTTIDKNIVDRTKARRNSEVARAVRRTRDRLSEQAGNPVYDRELLKLHANAVLNTAPAIPLMVLVVSVAGFAAGVGTDIAVWALVTIFCYSGLSLAARKVARTDTPDIDADGVRRTFLFGHVVSGFGWAYFAWLACAECQIEQFMVLKAVALLLVMAATAIIASALRGALIAAHAAPVFNPAAAPSALPTHLSLSAFVVCSEARLKRRRR